MEKKYNKKIKAMFKKGFSLVEVLVSLFIFSLIMVIISQNFISFFKNYNNSKLIQRDLEEAQYALAQIAKTLRTSVIVEVGGGTDADHRGYVIVFDNSQTKCFRYTFTGATLEVKAKSGVVTSNDCVGMTNDGAQQMVHMPVSGNFIFPKASSSAGNWRVGIITIRMAVGDQANVDDLVPIQTTVSLRDYINAN